MKSHVAVLAVVFSLLLTVQANAQPRLEELDLDSAVKLADLVARVKSAEKEIEKAKTILEPPGSNQPYS